MTILGRKLMSGDVLELPHLADDTGLDNSAGPIRKFYVVEDVVREAAGFDANWWPHLIRVKCQALVDTVEYRDILGDGDEADDLKHILSTYSSELEISEAILEQGENEVPRHGFEGGHIYIDEETHKPVHYYFKVPKQPGNKRFIILDPMLATGGTAIAAVNSLKDLGATRIKFMCLIAAPEGRDAFCETHPDIEVYTASLDERLDDNKYIIPGLGDAGDRLFGTK